MRRPFFVWSGFRGIGVRFDFEDLLGVAFGVSHHAGVVEGQDAAESLRPKRPELQGRSERCQSPHSEKSGVIGFWGMEKRVE